ncbi:tripartite tricarboxylate transporter substrate binding protein [Desulfitibacter alkalitolerans]|uniref:tripartite tricarboxylate transporter substrate binding protein n=1 Tax=Desulfitibacter alkalitolerans TaxID=264641 RepID=UPI0006865B13|nr:tripartite tricarboxylate transporter substrate binding protein [Desulfitibacter alkalitolerans]
MKKVKMIFMIVLVVFSLCVVLTGCNTSNNAGGSNGGGDDQQAINFPTRPITLIVPYSAGGGSDLISRRLAQTGAEDVLGVPINVINMPGGSGAVGYAELTNRAADGYTLVNCTSTIVTLKLLGHLDLNHDDFKIVIGYNYEPAAIGVYAGLGIDTLEEFIEYSKQKTVSMGTTAEGGIWNIATHAAEEDLGVKWNIIPDGGGGAGPVIEAAGGNIDAVTASPLEIFGQAEAGNLKFLAIMSDERLEAFPDIPTFKELGYNTVVTTTRSLLAHKDTPQEIIDILYEAFLVSANSQEYKEFVKNSGAGWLNYDGAKMKEVYDRENEIFAKILN